MFGLRPKLPVTDEERNWVDDGFLRLERALGEKRMRQCTVILPTDEFFPDPYDRSGAALESIFRRICSYMHVDRSLVELAEIPDVSELVEILPEYRHSSHDPAGLHFGKEHGGKSEIAVRKSLLKDPLTVVATIAHELGHVILLDGGHLPRDAEDMEPMTDLVTVYLGLGVFTANAARRFVQYQDDRRYGWSMSRHGYLPEEVYGYALALFAKQRSESKPLWAEFLCTNVRTYLRQSARWLEAGITGQLD
jgi:hypothetical protein